MSRKRHPAKRASTSASTPTAGVNSAQLTHEQQAIGLALAGGALATPLLLALLDKALSLEEIQSICYRAREIAGHFDDLPEGRFALACLDDFLLPRTSRRMSEATDSSPAIVPSDAPESAQPSHEADGTEPSLQADVTATDN
jgi:hypothetical protein